MFSYSLEIPKGWRIGRYLPVYSGTYIGRKEINDSDLHRHFPLPYPTSSLYSVNTEAYVGLPFLILCVYHVLGVGGYVLDVATAAKVPTYLATCWGSPSGVESGGKRERSMYKSANCTLYICRVGSSSIGMENTEYTGENNR